MAELRIAVRVVPRATRNEVTVRDGAVIVRVTAAAVDGRANRAVCRVLAEHLGLRPSAVRIMRGERSRDKLIALDGIEDQALRARLQLIGAPPSDR